jgi:hypothetical protein
MAARTTSALGAVFTSVQAKPSSAESWIGSSGDGGPFTIKNEQPD